MDRYKTIKRLDECNEEEIKELLIGRKVKVEGNNLILDNGIVLEVIANEGCGGCSSGWYSITKLNEVDNAITNVEFECNDIKADEENNYSDTSYKIFVFCEDTRINLLQVDGSDGNGYYGTGYEIIVKQKDTYISKADEMFEKLGYKLDYEDDISFTLSNTNNAKLITFMKETKTLMLSANITMEELQVINLKCKELGWLDE